MYLSRLTLNPSSVDARRDLGDAYQLHRTLSRVYAAAPDGPVARFVWRLDPDQRSPAGHTLLVQSAQAGRWQPLAERADYLLDTPQTDKVVDLDSLVNAGQPYHFRLRANPAVKRDGKRWGLHDAPAQLDWLGRQGRRVGFELLGADVSQRQRLRASHGEAGGRITIDTVLFDGVLRCVDAQALRHCLCAGIGPGKALGLGMLSLAPAR